jgi:hypothetical protein
MISYTWYEVVKGTSLEQGDILFDCPVILPIPDLTFPLKDDSTVIDVQNLDLILMTQSCDIENEKLNDMILCPHWDLQKAGQMDPALGRKGVWNHIQKGQVYQYALLDQWQGEGISMGIRIVHFGRILSLPRNFVKQFAENSGKRLRLCSPYREHLSQSFARFFMRVGLPQDIKLPG